MRLSSLRTNKISFTYNNILKREWLKGNMPSVKHDIGGNLLTKENVSLGHMMARSKGGTNELSNFTLETIDYNCMKGNKPFSWFFDVKNFMQYCDEVSKVRLPKFNGLEYAKSIIANAFTLLKEGK